MSRFIVFLAIAATSAFCYCRDTAIYNGKLVNDLNANGQHITNIAPPTASWDLVTKGYVDLIGGVTPSVVTNVSGVVVTNAVASWALKPNPKPATSWDTLIGKPTFKEYTTNATVKISSSDIADGVIPVLPVFTAIATNDQSVVGLTNAVYSCSTNYTDAKSASVAQNTFNEKIVVASNNIVNVSYAKAKTYADGVAYDAYTNALAHVPGIVTNNVYFSAWSFTGEAIEPGISYDVNENYYEEYGEYYYTLTGNGSDVSYVGPYTSSQTNVDFGVDYALPPIDIVASRTMNRGNALGLAYYTDIAPWAVAGKPYPEGGGGTRDWNAITNKPAFTAIATNGAAVVALTNAAVASAVASAVGIASSASVTNAGAVAYAEGKFLERADFDYSYGGARWNKGTLELFSNRENPYAELALRGYGQIQNGNDGDFSWILDSDGNSVEDRFDGIDGRFDDVEEGVADRVKIHYSFSELNWEEFRGYEYLCLSTARFCVDGWENYYAHIFDGETQTREPLPTYLASTSWHGTNKTLTDYGITNTIPAAYTDARAGSVATNTFAALVIPATNDVFSLAKNYTSNSVANVQSIVQTWESFLDGSNVVFSITNYISGTYSLDTAKLRIMELRNGTNYVEVYNSRDEIAMHVNAFKTNDFRIATNSVVTSVNSQIAQKADRAWGKYTSTGEDISAVGYSNTVYITEPQTVFAGGTEYARFAVGEGSICVLTAKGAAAYASGDEGTFKFQDAGGTNYFGFARTDSYAIGADASGITVLNNVVTITYDITTSVKPCIWYKEDLTSNAPWEQLNLPDGTQVPGASHYVSWEQNPPAGKQVCAINCQEAKGFFRASIEVAGTAKFITNMPADLKAGIICTNTATGANGVVRPSFNGSTVNWTWSAQ